MSWFVNFASSSAAIRSWSCLDVFLSTLNPSWLSCRILCFSSYADGMDVRVFVKKLYIVFTNAIGLWFVNFEGFFFCIIIWLGLSSRKLVFVFVCNNGRKIRKIYCGNLRA